jgi:hypothetical protein
VIGIVLDGGGEERVDEGRLSEARLTRNLNSQMDEAYDKGAFVPL